jgi:hypothetical protein
MAMDDITIGESIRRYGRPALTAETPEDKLWECERCHQYYTLLHKALQRQIEDTDVLSGEFDTLYGRLDEAYALLQSYSTEVFLQRMAVMQGRKIEPP